MKDYEQARAVELFDRCAEALDQVYSLKTELAEAKRRASLLKHEMRLIEYTRHLEAAK